MTLKGQVNGVEWAMVIAVKQPGISRLKQGQKRGQLINSHTIPGASSLSATYWTTSSRGSS